MRGEYDPNTPDALRPSGNGAIENLNLHRVCGYQYNSGATKRTSDGMNSEGCLGIDAFSVF